MRRCRRWFAVLCASAFLLTACGGAGEEPADDLPPLSVAEEEQNVTEDEYAQSVTEDEQTVPDAQSVTGDGQTVPDAQSVTEDAQTAPDAQSATEDGQTVPDEEELAAQLLGETLPEVVAVGEGVGVGTLADGFRTVYLPENQNYVPFLVLSADYGGNALLLRRDALPESRPFNDYSAAYENSDIDRFLNGEYLDRLDAVRELVKPSEIVVTDADALGVSGDAAATLTRNVFLLSCAETGFTELSGGAKEGVPLSYFGDPARRVAYRENGAAVGWWLRTPDAYYLSVVYGVGPDGSLGNGNAYDENGVRPALCVAPDAQAFPTGDIQAGETVYFLPAVQ